MKKGRSAKHGRRAAAAGPLDLRTPFAFDVFLSYGSPDKIVARQLAELLQRDGLKVWFDDWVLLPGHSAAAEIEQGLERSRVLVLVISANAFGPEWAGLEATTFRFRDPVDRERRFIPIRVDDTPIRDPLAQFSYISWSPGGSEREYARLLEACRPPKTGEAAQPRERRLRPERVVRLDTQSVTGTRYAFSSDGKQALSSSWSGQITLWNLETGDSVRDFAGHSKEAWGVAWSSDLRRAISTSSDRTLRLWDIETGRCLRVLTGSTAGVFQTAWSNDNQRALSAEDDRVARVWDVGTGSCVGVLLGHTGDVRCVAWSPDDRQALSGAFDGSLRLWDIETGRCLRVLEGHDEVIWSVAWSANGSHALSGSRDRTVRLWDVESGRCLRVFEGHTDEVESVAWCGDYQALSGAEDKTVRLWDVENGRCLCVLRGHVGRVRTVTWSPSALRAFSGDDAGCVAVWDLSTFVRQAPTSMPIGPSLGDQVEYTNAKVLLVGDSGVGKSGLASYLAHGLKVDDDRPLTSTDGAWATRWPLPRSSASVGIEREMWLWDFAGQVDYRLVHQLFMEDAAAAVLVFNPQAENPFDGLGQWDRDLQRAARKPFARLLAAGRIDRGGLVVSATTIKKFMDERGFLPPLHLTSAKTGDGCDELREAIVAAIEWRNIPKTTSPALYHRMKQEILKLRDTGLVLIRLSELNQRMEMALGAQHFELVELEAVIHLLAAPGMIQRLDFGGFILLQPEVLSRYAAAVVRKVRQHPQEMGCIREDELLAGSLDYQDYKRLAHEDEAVVLRTLLDTFIIRAWCLRQPGDGSALLTFPSYFRRERTEQPSHPSVLVTYRFDGPVADIYATLVVHLHHTVAFESTDLWKSAADFKTQTDAKLGFMVALEAEGTSRLEVYFEPDVDETSRVLFLRYIHDHLIQHAQNVVRLRHYACGHKKCDSFGQLFADHAKVAKALAPGGKGKVFCPDCGKPIFLRDLIEEKFESPAVKGRVRALQVEGQAVIDNESRELLAVHHTGSIVAEAGQIYRGYTNSDHGIDGEVEFKDDQGRASGRRVYLQLKSGDSYLKKRQRDGAEIFQVKNSRWVDYWQQQAYPVMLVIRTSDNEIRWMDVSAYLKATAASGKTVKQIVFEGERLDVLSVRQWRNRLLRP